jgi:hypothetical protein
MPVLRLHASLLFLTAPVPGAEELSPHAFKSLVERSTAAALPVDVRPHPGAKEAP